MKKKKIDIAEYFVFPDLPILYPVYGISETGKLVNFKAIAYPTPRSRKRFTRQKQLVFRSLQAKIFDAIIEIGFFKPLTVWKEFPIIIQNSQRLPGQVGLFYYLDYYIPELHIAIELDSDLHNKELDNIRDIYLNNLGITVYRIMDLQKPLVQKKEFPKLVEFLKSKPQLPMINFNFFKDLSTLKPLK